MRTAMGMGTDVSTQPAFSWMHVQCQLTCAFSQQSFPHDQPMQTDSSWYAIADQKEKILLTRRNPVARLLSSQTVDKQAVKYTLIEVLTEMPALKLLMTSWQGDCHSPLRRSRTV